MAVTGSQHICAKEQQLCAEEACVKGIYIDPVCNARFLKLGIKCCFAQQKSHHYKKVTLLTQFHQQKRTSFWTWEIIVYWTCTITVATERQE